MRSWIFMLIVAFAATSVLGQEAQKASSNETSAADAAPVKPDPDAAADVAEAKPFKIPPGFRTKTRGDKVMYCRKDVISGSRFGTEKCYTEEQITRMTAESEAAKQEVEKATRTCAATAECSPQ